MKYYRVKNTREITRRVVGIDIDVDKDDDILAMCTQPLAVEKALYQYSWIKRKVVITRHGYHIYLDIPQDSLKDYYTIFMLRALFGDDVCRLNADESRYIAGLWANRLFTNTERHEYSWVMGNE